jgi:hypothetical protein
MPARATKPQARPKQPTVVVIAGPNGAGKSTAAPYLLKDALGILEFVNADQIAAGLSAYAPETVAFEAGRIMLQRLRTLAAAKVSFAFETTLSSRTLCPVSGQLQGPGLPSAYLLRGPAQRRTSHPARGPARQTGRTQRTARRHCPPLSAQRAQTFCAVSALGRPLASAEQRDRRINIHRTWHCTPHLCRGPGQMAESSTTRAVERTAPNNPATSVQGRVENALKQASNKAKKQLIANGLKLPTQSWTGTAVKNPAA